jgi:FixJ family two-component response regulator
MSATRRRNGHYDLTEKQREAIAFVDAGLTRQEIAERLGISKRAVDLRIKQARKWQRTRAIAEQHVNTVIPPAPARPIPPVTSRAGHARRG